MSLQTVSSVRTTSSAKNYEVVILKLNMLIGQSTGFQKLYEFNKQIAERIDPHWVNNAEFSDFEFLKKLFMDITLHNILAQLAIESENNAAVILWNAVCCYTTETGFHF